MASDDKIEIEIALKNAKEAVKTLESITKKSEELPQKVESSFAKAGTSISNGFNLIKKNALVAIAGITAVLGSLKVAFDLTKEAAKFKQSTDAMFSQFGLRADDVLKALRKVSDGTISNANLVTSANKVMALNVTKDVGKMAKLLEVARVRARAMGIDTTQAFEDIATGIGRNSPLILDNLGIVTKGWDAEAKAKGVSYDTQFILNKVLEDGNKILEQTGKLTLTSKERYDKLDATFQNIKTRVGTSLLPIMERLLKVTELYTNIGSGKSSEAERSEATRLSYQEKSVETLTRMRSEREKLSNQLFKESDELKKQLAIEEKKRFNGTKIKELKQQITDNDKSQVILTEEIAISTQVINKKQEETKNTQTKTTEELVKAKEALAEYVELSKPQLQKDIERLTALRQQAILAGDITTQKRIEKELGDKILEQQRQQQGIKKTTPTGDAPYTGSSVGGAKGEATLKIIEKVAVALDGIGNVLEDIGELAGNKGLGRVGQAFAFIGGAVKDAAASLAKGDIAGAIIGIATKITIAILNQKQMAKDIGNSWKETYKGIVEDAQRAAFEQEKAAANLRFKEISENSATAKELRKMDEEDRERTQQELRDDIATETDLDEKANLERQLKRMELEEIHNQQVKDAQKVLSDQLADIKKREFAYEKALKLAQIKIDRQEAIAEAEKLFWKKDRDAAKRRVNEGYDAIEGVVNSIPEPAFAQGGSFITSGPQSIRVGDNNGGRERVTVEPMTGNSAGGSGITLNNVTIQANNPQQFFDALNNYQRQYGVI